MQQENQTVMGESNASREPVGIAAVLPEIMRRFEPKPKPVAYTPGPWLVGNAIHASLSPGVHIIADGVGFPAHAFGRTPAEAIANAKLIASAPDLATENARLRQSNAELLAACKALYFATPDCEGGDIGVACRDARRTIAQAEANI